MFRNLRDLRVGVPFQEAGISWKESTFDMLVLKKDFIYSRLRPRNYKAS